MKKIISEDALGRPSHALHTYWVGNLRLVLDVVASPGKEHSAAKARPGLIGVLEKLIHEKRQALVRGDCGFGKEPFTVELEERAQPYLFFGRITKTSFFQDNFLVFF